MILFSSVGAEATGDALVAVILVERAAAEPTSGLMAALSTSMRSGVKVVIGRAAAEPTSRSMAALSALVRSEGIPDTGVP
jgi:hypothetical protein